MHRAFSDLRSCSAAAVAVVASLVLGHTAFAQSSDLPPLPPIVSTGGDFEDYSCDESEVAFRPVCQQWRREVEVWKQQQKAKGEPTHAPSATGDPKEWVTVHSDSTGVEKQIVDQVILQINNALNKGVPYAPQGQMVEIMQKARGRGESVRGAYKDLETFKAVAACIAWDASRLGNIAARSVGMAFKARYLHEAVQSAMFQCER